MFDVMSWPGQALVLYESRLLPIQIFSSISPSQLIAPLLANLIFLDEFLKSSRIGPHEPVNNLSLLDENKSRHSRNTAREGSSKLVQRSWYIFIMYSCDTHPYLAATSGASSTSTLTKMTPENSWLSCLKMGAIILHGPHQVAVKSMTMSLPLRAADDTRASISPELEGSCSSPPLIWATEASDDLFVTPKTLLPFPGCEAEVLVAVDGQVVEGVGVANTFTPLRIDETNATTVVAEFRIFILKISPMNYVSYRTVRSGRSYRTLLCSGNTLREESLVAIILSLLYLVPRDKNTSTVAGQTDAATSDDESAKRKKNDATTTHTLTPPHTLWNTPPWPAGSIIPYLCRRILIISFHQRRCCILQNYLPCLQPPRAVECARKRLTSFVRVVAQSTIVRRRAKEPTGRATNLHVMIRTKQISTRKYIFMMTVDTYAISRKGPSLNWNFCLSFLFARAQPPQERVWSNNQSIQAGHGREIGGDSGVSNE